VSDRTSVATVDPLVDCFSRCHGNAIDSPGTGQIEGKPASREAHQSLPVLLRATGKWESYVTGFTILL